MTPLAAELCIQVLNFTAVTSVGVTIDLWCDIDTQKVWFGGVLVTAEYTQA